jgi:hypothetical protein
MTLGWALNLYLWLFTGVVFTWNVVLGGLGTFVAGYSASCFCLKATGVCRTEELKCN